MKRKSDDAKKAKTAWLASEDDALLKAVVEDQQDRDAEGDGEDEEDWDEIAKSVPGKTPVQCLKRYIALNRKQAGSTSSSTAASTPIKEDDDGEEEDDDDDDEEEAGSPAAKKQKASKKDSDGAGKWTNEEVELLKKLVEQYKDSEYTSE